MRRSSLLAIAILVLLSASGCASFVDYWKARGADLSESIQLAFGGPGLGAHVEATTLLATGADVWLAYGDGGMVGNFTRRVPGPEDFAGYSVIAFHARGVDTDPLSRDPTDDSLFLPVHAGPLTHAHEYTRFFKEERVPENLEPLRWLDVGVDVAFVIGVRARFSPGQFLDFLVGFVGVDLDPAKPEAAVQPERQRVGALEREPRHDREPSGARRDSPPQASRSPHSP